MSRLNKFTAFAAILLTALSVYPQNLQADFQLTDAIQEFGEKRYVKTGPARLHAGPLRIHPTLVNRVGFDSNILSEPEDEKHDVVFNVRPGAILELPINKHQLAVGYAADFEIFTKHRNHKQNDANQDFFALADLNFPDWYVNVLEKFSETSSRSGTTFTSRIPRFDQSINPKIGYRWKRFTFESGFRHFLRDFRQQVMDPFDFQVTEFTEVLYYDLFARLKAFFEYQFAKIDYNDDYTRKAFVNQMRVGLQGEIMPRLTAKVRTGLQFRNSTTSSEPDFYSWIGDILVEYQVRDNFKVHAGFSREPVEATFQSVNFFKEHLLKVGFDYEVRPNWTVFTESKYYRHDYAERAVIGQTDGFRHDNHIGVETGLRYITRDWLSWKLSYEYLRRASNFGSLDYTDHQVSLTSNLAY